VRYIGVDLHKTNFVVCFLNEDDTSKLETFPLSKAGIACFTKQLKKGDAVAVEARKTFITFMSRSKPSSVALCWLTLIGFQ